MGPIRTIKFLKSGGVTGVVRGCELEVRSLPASEQQRLAEMVRDAKLKNAPSRATPGSADLGQYEIVVEDDDKSQTYQLSDDSITAEQRALVRFLSERSGPRRLP
jgi:hypothetical protein